MLGVCVVTEQLVLSGPVLRGSADGGSVGDGARGSPVGDGSWHHLQALTGPPRQPRRF